MGQIPYQPLQYGPGMGANGMGGSMFGINHFGTDQGVAAGTSNISTTVPAGVAPNGGVMPSMGDTLNTILSGAGDPVAGAGGAAAQGWFGKIGGLEGIGSIFKGLGDLGSVYAAIKGVGLAKEQLAFSRSSYNTNLGNQTQSYNTALEGKANAMAAADGTSRSQVEAYLKKHSL